MELLDCTANSCAYTWLSVHGVLQLLISAFFAILFLQSGLDKVSDRSGNIDFMRGHFAKSAMKNMVPALLFILTLIELSAGTLSLVGIIVFLIKQCDYWMFWGNLMSAKAILMLFFGQRLAKDYAGAQSLVSYFIVSLIGIWLCS